MQAELFYKNQAQDIIPVILLSKQDWASGMPELLSSERNQFYTQRFKGNTGDLCIISGENGKSQKVYLGAGDANNYSLALASAALRLPEGNYQLQQALPNAHVIFWGLAQYCYDRYKKQEIQPRVLILENNLREVLQDVDAAFLVRDLINAPTNCMGPQDLSDTMKTLATRYSASFQEWIGDELLAANFPAIHAVGRASINQPRLLSLNWGNEKHPKVTLVGKGVCFDTGGLDIKPSNFMRLMKKDMGGAAQVLGLAQWIMARELPIRLQVLIPAVENSIGPDAYRPGDVLTMRNGLTVEIDNTDAEGRLVLADALVFAGEDKPELIIDFATLTGAARTAVGTEISALFCNNDKLANELYEFAGKANDPVWRLPLYAAYEPLLDSSIADLSNCSASPYAGAIVAALFLQRFVPAGIPWVHFDVMAWNVSSKPGKPEGGEAMGIRAVGEYLLSRYAGA
ncbi:aminopeptidase [Legionella birminghamensis]|uniref:Aminopeptidase n=1 Tax=Legionella birminghamensis TaxID=28083 RepID=A0A378IDB2_9GAMM|nr:leucyl aminopeptidase family protein [Legionella birminghamensis]KTC71632.1 aminopeptidase [Legionella birminghamensis]STX32531.1 aminopeptidase [Legionella birminghamensis]